MKREKQETTIEKTEILPGSQKELDELYSFLLDRFNLDFSQYRQTTISRRLIRRISLAQKKDLTEYLAFIKENALEAELLYNNFLLNFTEFFRDEPVFDHLTKEIFPQLIREKSVKSGLRVWVPGCSSGEEVYSLAITLHEYLEDQKIQIPLQFFGTDLVEENILTARKAVYQLDGESHVSPDRLSRFFDQTDQGYKVTRFIREQCAFSVHDLIHDPPFPRMDLVSCRNVLIYLNEALQDRILPLFHYSLNSKGYLLLGTSESMGRYTDLFHPVDNHSHIFRKKVTGSGRLRHHSFFTSHLKSRETRAVTFEERRENQDNVPIASAMDQVIQQYYTPPALLIDGSLRIRQFRGDLSPFLKPSEGEASLLLSKMIPRDWLSDIIVSLEEVKKGDSPVKRKGVNLFNGTASQKLDYTLISLEKKSHGESLFCLVFDSITPMEPERKDLSSPSETGEESDREIKRLRHELDLIKSHLQTIIQDKEDVNQELWSANEEIQSTNEELLSVNEELEAAKEELESGNEELRTLNEELNLKNNELVNLNNKNAEVLAILDQSQKCAHIGTWWIMLPENRMNWTEEAACIFGFGPEVKSVSFEELLERIHVEDRSEISDLLYNYQPGVSGGNSFTKSLRCQLAGGEMKYLETSSQFERDAGGEPIRVSGTIQDVTQKISAEKELRQSETFLSSVINSIQDGICVLDRDLNILQVNPVMNEWYKRDTPLEGKKCYTCYHGKEHICNPCPTIRAFSSGKVESDVVPGAEGSDLDWVELYSYPMRDPLDGRITGVVEFVRDVTEKIRVESALEESEARLRRYIEAAPVGIVVNDLGGKILDINEAACRIFDVDRKNALELSADKLILTDSLEDYEAVLAINNDLLEKGFAAGEIRYLNLDGRHKSLLMSAARISGEGDFISFISDISSQRDLEVQLNQAEKMQVIGQLAGGIAHDFNNQLTGILGYADVISEQISPDAEEQDYLEGIRNIVDRASGLTSQLLAFSRKGKFQAIPLDMNGIIREVANLLEHSMDKKIVLEQNLSEDDCIVLGDPTQLQNVILNLALNARDAMPGGGTITFETSVRNITIPPPFFKPFDVGPGRYRIISVIDTGYGMAEDVLERIFEPFFTTKEQGKGTGMGLAAVYGTIKNHSGAIDVVSIKDKGSQFTFYLPCYE